MLLPIAAVLRAHPRAAAEVLPLTEVEFRRTTPAGEIVARP